MLPEGYSYDSAARNACLAVRTEADAKPLRAVLEGDRLTVDFAKLEPDWPNFVLKGKRVTSCRKLESLPARRSPTVTTRQK
jgi:hypothetical protein